VQADGVSLGVDWGKVRIYSAAKEPPGYRDALAKGPPFSYQAYASQLRLDAAQGPICFTLAGGNMLGGKLRSNVAVISPESIH
jgi:hypothetical protein